MKKIHLRKLKNTDIKYFAKWWRDKNLLKLTSGILKPITDQEVGKYFSAMVRSKTDYHFMIRADKKIIGHISLIEQRNNWYETQVVIGDKNYWNKGIGTKAINILVNIARKNKVSKIYLEVRPNNLRAIRAYEKCGFQKVRIKKYPKNKYLPKTLKMELK